MNFIDELTWRGMIHQMMPGTDEQLKKGMTAAYLGIDPTADSLHIGHLVGVMMLKHFQRSGHKPIALVGGATGMIGDPSMKSQERKLLDVETLRHNQEAIKQQLARFLDFDSDAPNAAILVNNYDWMKDYTFLDFIRDVGKNLTVNYMMAKDSVKKRLSGESGEGMSFTEFSYQLLQGYDFLHLYEAEGCRLQLGGSDQWGNITTGTELIRRTVGGEAYALTCPLITKADGENLHKAELARTQFQSALRLFPMPESEWRPRVYTCSSVDRTGLEEVWAGVEQFLEHTGRNGYFTHNRSRQNKYWMYETINETLRNAFYRDPRVEAAIGDCEQRVLDARLSSFIAAKELLDIYFGERETPEKHEA